jgi:hypothetical protein
MPTRRFPLPWWVDEATESFCARCAKEQGALAYIYLEDEPDRRTAVDAVTRSRLSL